MGGRLIPHEPIFSDGPLARLAREGSGIAATESLKGRRLRAAPPAVPTSTTAPQHRAAVQTACSLFEGPEGNPHQQNPRALIKRRRAHLTQTSSAAAHPPSSLSTTTRSSGASNKNPRRILRTHRLKPVLQDPSDYLLL